METPLQTEEQTPRTKQARALLSVMTATTAVVKATALLTEKERVADEAQALFQESGNPMGMVGFTNKRHLEASEAREAKDLAEAAMAQACQAYVFVFNARNYPKGKL